MITDFSGDFLNVKSSKDGDIAEILDEGAVVFSNMLNKNVFNIKVRVNNKNMIFSPSNESGRILQQSFGQDSKSWIGKKFEIVHFQGKMKIRPIKEEKVL